MGLNSKLVTKIIGASIADLPSSIRGCKKASTYNFISGTGKKGDFQVYSFFDEAGNLIKRHRTYKLGDNITKEVSYYRDFNPSYFSYSGKQTITFKDVNGHVQSSKNTIQYGASLRTEEEILQGTNYSSHRIIGLYQGKAPKEISYKTNWDGNVPYDVQVKGGNFTLPDGAEYMPLFTSPQNPKRFEHLEQVALNQQELKGVAPKARILSREQFYKEVPYAKDYEQANGGLIDGDANPETGQVRIINDTDVYDLINTYAHEWQHVRDYSDLIRTQRALAKALEMEKSGTQIKGFKINYKLNDFKRKSIEKGVIEEGTDEYNELINKRWIEEHENYDTYCREGKHDEAFAEQSEIEKGKLEQNRFADCMNKIFEFFGYS